MRTENELVNQIRELKSIEPKKEWVISTKNNIMKENHLFSFGMLFKPAMAGVLTLCLFAGVFVFAQGSLPGDSLYPVKKITEKARLSFVSKNERPNVQLEIANDKLESLVVVVQSENVDKVDPIIEEYQANVSEAARELTRVEDLDVKEVVEKTRKIRETKEKIEALGVKVADTEELNEALAQIVERQIKELEEAALTESQIEIFDKAKTDYEEKNYSDALEKILLLSYQEEK